MADVPQGNPYEYVEEDTPDLLNCFIRGEPDSLEKVMARHEQRLLTTARRLIRCIQMYDSAYAPEDAVNETWARVCQRIKDGKFTLVQESVGFWKMFSVCLKNEILRRIGDSTRPSAAAGSPSGDDWHERRWHVVTGGDSLPGKGYRCSEHHLDQAYARLPPPQDLVLAQLEAELFHETLCLADPLLGKIFNMRQEDYTAAEIAAKLELSVRTIERKLGVIREKYFKQWGEMRRET